MSVTSYGSDDRREKDSRTDGIIKRIGARRQVAAFVGQIGSDATDSPAQGTPTQSLEDVRQNDCILCTAPHCSHWLGGVWPWSQQRRAWAWRRCKVSHVSSMLTACVFFCGLSFVLVEQRQNIRQMYAQLYAENGLAVPKLAATTMQEA